MEPILNNIVSLKDTPRKSIDMQLLERYTKKIEGSIIRKIRWTKLQHLYILGNASAAESPLEFAAYEDIYQRWVLIVGAQDEHIQKFLSKCPPILEKLAIRFTGLRELELQRLMGLKTLMLECNRSLEKVMGFEQMPELKKLHLSNTAVRSLEFPKSMPQLSVLYANRTPLERADFLHQLPCLRVLNLSRSSIRSLPSLDQHTLLRVLDLNGTPLSSLDGLALPENLASLDLSELNIPRLPQTLRRMRMLEFLNLSHTILEELPRWLPELGLEFSIEEKGRGIRLYGTQIPGVNMRIFTQSRELILRWFDGLREDDQPFNDVKVVFIGSKGAGKTTLLYRMIGDDVSRTSVGCPIMTKGFFVNGQHRRVRFWDIDSPEIQFRLHDVFLRDRTIYVLVLDAMEENLRARAEKWLGEIRDYTMDVPVIMVVNRADLKTVDMGELEDLSGSYGNIRQILSLSALSDSPEQFQRSFQQPLLEQVLSFPELMQNVPHAWRELARQVAQYDAPFMGLEHYTKLCEQWGIGDFDTQNNLLQCFSDLGICVHRDYNPYLRYSILCDIEWFVKSVTEFFKAAGSETIELHSELSISGGGPASGVMQRGLLEQCLINMAAGRFPDAHTEKRDEQRALVAEQLLGLLRSCKLSIYLSSDLELLPLLCSRKTAKIFHWYQADPQAKNVRIDFRSLPAFVIHMLIDAQGRNLDLQNVRYHGARFVDLQSGDSLVVQKEGDCLQFYSQSEGSHHYLAHMVDLVNLISQRYRLEIEDHAQRRQKIQECLRQEAGQEPVDSMLNEIRVMVLGDGEAGKSCIIRRLLKLRLENEEVLDDTGDATPGVEIHHGTYELIGGRRVRLNFWDFGGQEILHSMHRIFITEQTMCIIVLNARSDTQDDRARYWLRYIQSVSPQMPVLLVLNKMDQNLNASINEYELSRMYPSLEPTVCISAAKDDDDSIRNTLLRQLLRQIGAMDALQTRMPDNWWKVKEVLQTSAEPYIREEAYRQLCRKYHVSDEGDMHTQLLDWFNIMGVGYRCDSAERIGTYMILRPEWVTNAVYAILFNRHEDVKNGIVSRKSLNELLRHTDKILCVDQNTGYNADEVDYVIQMMRRYNLSYCIQEDGRSERQEFIPMLCRRNASPEVGRYADDPDTLEFWIRFEYLPDALLFHMMVSHYKELDRENVWLTGARFVEPGTGSSAVIKREDQTLKVYVRSDRFYPHAARYRDTIRRRIRDLIRDYLPRLKILEECVVYKHHGGVEAFDFERLSRCQSNGMTHCYSKICDEPLSIQDILSQSNQAEQERMGQLMDAVVSACKKMQEVPQHKEEDRRNKQLMHILSGREIQGKPLIVLDQSQGGRGKTGIRMGERDLMFSTEADTPWVILEALNISGAKDKPNWKGHLDKLLDHYNPYGLKHLCMVSYVNCEQKSFAGVWKGFRDLIQTYDPTGWKLIPGMVQPVELKKNTGTNALKLLRCCYSSGAEGESQTQVYHLFVRLDTAT